MTRSSYKFHPQQPLNDIHILSIMNMTGWDASWPSCKGKDVFLNLAVRSASEVSAGSVSTLVTGTYPSIAAIRDFLLSCWLN